MWSRDKRLWLPERRLWAPQRRHLVGAARAAMMGAGGSAVAGGPPVIEAYALQLADLGSVSSKTVTLTLSAGDLALGFMVESSSRTLNLPTGYADVHGGQIAHDDLSTMQARWMWDILASGITEQAFTVSGGTSTEFWPGLLRISGAHATSPIHQQAFTTDQIDDNTIVCPAISDTTVNNCLILRVISSYESSAGSVEYPSGTTGVFLDQVGPSGAAHPESVSVAYEVKEMAGAVGVSNVWGDWDLTKRVIAGTMAIAPAA